MLARLLLDPGRPVAADALLDAGWPDSPREQAARSLGVRIANLRSFLEPDRAPGAPATVLVRVGPGYKLAIDPEQVDSHRARRLVSEAAERAPADALALFDKALALWHGAPFAEVFVQRRDQLNPGFEKSLPKRLANSSFRCLGVLTEELKVLAVVKDVEAVFVLVRPK